VQVATPVETPVTAVYQSPGGTVMILQTKTMPELHSKHLHQSESADFGKHFSILGNGWKSNGAKSGLQGR